MKIKTSELIGKALNFAVAKCNGKGIDLSDKHDPWLTSDGIADQPLHSYTPSTDWSQGGPIIERERIKVAPNLGGTWHGQIRHIKDHPLSRHLVLSGWTNQHGPTPLVAVMRCYVAIKLGDEVEIPEELK
jgi:hypothetical protein